ncbi:hypothetical protein CesoFtcFv8_005745 [Champsocephalus esox]|uniref:Uncharacterized protein n=1 Tax=Champsocephalus esox TaxID=159716 RepID=A0AAN8CI30_9TELE|nr:hypothetical protein CesoFtcFv8_005745 [Champsocephalus esox]
MDPQASKGSQDPPGPMDHQDLRDRSDAQDHQDTSGSLEKPEIRVTWDVQGQTENPVTEDVPDPKVMRETQLVVSVRLEARGRLETSVHKELLDFEEILEEPGSRGTQESEDVKEIQAMAGIWAHQVWSAPPVPEVVRVFQAFRVQLVLTVLQVLKASWDSKVRTF